MGKFSNGEAGRVYRRMYCDKCVHDENCAIWLAHLTAQPEDERVLDLLIPHHDGQNQQCAMFWEWDSLE